MAERRLARCGGSAALPPAPPRRSRTLGNREEVFTCLSCGQACITRAYRDHSFTSRFHGNNTGAASAVVRPKRRRTPRPISIASIAMTQSIAGQPAPELAVPYWIGAEGKERPPLTLKELGARHRLLFLPALVRWLPLARISNSSGIGSRSPHRGRRGRRSPDRIRPRGHCSGPCSDISAA